MPRTALDEKPNRLWRDRAGWVLEVTGLKSSDGQVFSPETTLVSGAVAILSKLRNLGSRKLALGAEAIFRSTDHQNSTYRARGEAWMPMGQSPSFVNASGERARQLGGADLSGCGPCPHAASIAELQVEFMLLRQSQVSLQKKVARLERQRALSETNQKTFGHSSWPNQQVRPATDSEPEKARAGHAAAAAKSDATVVQPTPTGSPVAHPARAEQTPADNGVVSTEATAAADHARVDTHQGEAAAAHILDGREASKGNSEEMSGALDAPPIPEVPLVLPQAKEIGERLGALLGERVALHPTEPGKMAYVCELRNDGDATVGAMALNANAITRWGGTLLMLPTPEIQQQLQDGVPSESCVEATAEICNVLSAEFNTMPENCHSKVGALTEVEEMKHDWLRLARTHAAMTDEDGGVIILYAL